MRRLATLVPALLLAACAAGGLGAPPGQAALAPADEAEIKTLALRGARQELLREGLLRPGGVVTFLDTLVGPTPAEHLYDWTHRTEWLEAMRANALVDALVGPRSDRHGLSDWGLVIEVGAPFRQGRDTVAILYDWCLQRIPLRRAATGGNIRVWRDAFLRADTGWTRVGHAPAIAPMACTR